MCTRIQHNRISKELPPNRRDPHYPPWLPSCLIDRPGNLTCYALVAKTKTDPAEHQPHHSPTAHTGTTQGFDSQECVNFRILPICGECTYSMRLELKLCEAFLELWTIGIWLFNDINHFMTVLSHSAIIPFQGCKRYLQPFRMRVTIFVQGFSVWLKILESVAEAISKD